MADQPTQLLDPNHNTHKNNKIELGILCNTIAASSAQTISKQQHTCSLHATITKPNHTHLHPHSSTEHRINADSQSYPYNWLSSPDQTTLIGRPHAAKHRTSPLSGYGSHKYEVMRRLRPLSSRITQSRCNSRLSSWLASWCSQPKHLLRLFRLRQKM